jgi:signal transduction histidine kinase/CheY-like chemotaxis protein
MIRNLRETTQKNSEQDWLKTNLAKFTRMLQGQRDLVPVAQLILNELAPVVSAQHGAFFIVEPGDTQRLDMLASYAYTPREGVPRSVPFGQGLVGQVAVKPERIVLSNIPPDYIKVSSGLGEATPLSIIVLPILFEGQLRAVLELASFDRFGPTYQTFLDQLAETIGIVLNTIEANMRTEALLSQSQSLALELQNRQEELQKTNAELETKARLLVEQNAEVEKKNHEVELAKAALEEKAEQLALTSKYKSEFLSNMSHELRTPLNSLLILSKQLADNPHGNLNQRQVEFARTIHASGSDLLTLINDILDLSKIESGTVTIDLANVPFRDIEENVVRTFRHVAEGKNLPFSIELDPTLPAALYTDAKRLLQVLKNLLSNAFKFTRAGSVTLHISVAHEGWTPGHSVLTMADEVVAFSVRDTGIGIPADKQKVIFEAFQQADGSTSRKYGGTGLGLSISREISRLLGGEITLESSPNEGSIFTLYLPRVHIASRQATNGADYSLPSIDISMRRNLRSLEFVSNPDSTNRVDDDRDRLEVGDRPVLIIEDDADFARILLQTARERGFKAVVAHRAAEGLELARRIRPAGVTLDLHLPDADGWEVLDRLRSEAETSSIPIHVITGEERDNRYPDEAGLTFLRKPVSQEDLTLAFAGLLGDMQGKRLLIVEDNDVQREDIVQRLSSLGIAVEGVATGAAALAALENGAFDGLIVDLTLPDMSGRTVIEKIRQNPVWATVPIVVHTARDLNPREIARLKRSAQSIVHKDSRSSDRLLDEVKQFLFHVAKNTAVAEPTAAPDRRLASKKVLVVDDDVRNIFALTGLLERHEMQVLAAENGRDAIQKLRATSDIDIILMDVMMPELDGYQTMRAIRQETRYANLPIVAITAKAMRGDREKCIEAGASDYVAKPVNDELLLTVLRSQLLTRRPAQSAVLS